MRQFLTVCALFVLTYSLSALDPITVGKKQIFILSSNNKEVIGTSYFGVYNYETTPKEIEFEVFLPKGISKVVPREGFAEEDLSINSRGEVTVKKTFAPKLTLLGIDFRIPYSYSERKPLIFNPPFDLQELSLSTPRFTGLSLESDGFFSGLPDMLSGDAYRGILKKSLKKGELFTVEIKGLPRSNFGTFLVVLACGLSLFLILFFYFLSSLKFKSDFL